MHLILSSSEEEQLRNIQHYSKERWVYIRITAVLMLHEGFAAEQVSNVLGIRPHAVSDYICNYRSGGLQRLISRDF